MPKIWMQLGLWCYFICAIFFVYGSVLSGDLISILGSCFFLLGAVFFLLGFYSDNDKG